MNVNKSRGLIIVLSILAVISSFAFDNKWVALTLMLFSTLMAVVILVSPIFVIFHDRFCDSFLCAPAVSAAPTLFGKPAPLHLHGGDHLHPVYCQTSPEDQTFLRKQPGCVGLHRRSSPGAKPFFERTVLSDQSLHSVL